MIIIDHDMHSGVAKGSLDIAKDALECGINLINGLTTLENIMHQWDLTNDGIKADFDDQQCLCCADCCDLLDTGILLYAQFLYTSQQVVKDKLDIAVDIWKQLKDVLQTVSDAFVPLQSREISIINKCSGVVIGNLAYFIYYEFDMSETFDSIKDKRELAVNSVVNFYCDKNGVNLVMLVNNIKEQIESHNITTLSIYEDLSIYESFEEKLGDSFDLIDKYNYLLNEEDIQGILSGDLSPAELYAQLMVR